MMYKFKKLLRRMSYREVNYQFRKIMRKLFKPY